MNAYLTYSDEYLLALLKNSDEGAFTEIYNRYWEKLLFMAGVRLRDLSVAEDLVQDIFLDIWNRRFDLEVEGRLEAYLAASIKYRIINVQVKLKKKRECESVPVTQRRDINNHTEQRIAFEELRYIETGANGRKIRLLFYPHLSAVL